jgi:hypothetical protein
MGPAMTFVLLDVPAGVDGDVVSGDVAGGG